MPPRKKPTTEDAATPVKKGRAKKAPATAVAKPATRRKTSADAGPDDAAPPKAGRGRKGNLVIVESPAKAKTIEKYLGPGFTVRASYGHVRDLPSGRRVPGEEVVGVNIKNGWVPPISFRTARKARAGAVRKKSSTN